MLPPPERWRREGSAGTEALQKSRQQGTSLCARSRKKCVTWRYRRQEKSCALPVGRSRSSARTAAFTTSETAKHARHLPVYLSHAARASSAYKQCKSCAVCRAEEARGKGESHACPSNAAGGLMWRAEAYNAAAVPPTSCSIPMRRRQHALRVQRRRRGCTPTAGSECA